MGEPNHVCSAPPPPPPPKKKKKKNEKKNVTHGYSSESTQQELSNEYQHDKVEMVLKNL